MKPLPRFHALSIILSITVAIGLLFVLVTPAAAGSVESTNDCRRYANSALPAPGDGLTWETAFHDLQPAIDAAPAGCQVWVAKGTYLVPPGFRLSSFTLKNGVGIYGGFVGNETVFSQRNHFTHLTILSGDIGTPNYAADNAESVVYVTYDITNSAVLDGFTIMDGDASGSRVDGGGIYFYAGGSPTLSNLYIEHNHANNNGGGVFIDHGSPVFSNVIFENNTAKNGAGVYLTDHSSATFNLVFFTANSATTDGGGLFNDSTSTNLTINNSSFNANHAGHAGGGADIYGAASLSGVDFDNNTADFGAGLLVDNLVGGSITSDLSLTNVTFTNNSATSRGGGIYIYRRSPVLTNVTFSQNHATASYGSGGAIGDYQSSPTLTNVVFSQNSSPAGGAIANDQSSPTLTNVTFSQNTSPAGGGIYNTDNSHPLVRNSILWGDSGGEVYNAPVPPAAAPSSIKITYSLVQGCNPGGLWNSSSCGLDGGSNLVDIDPKFKNSGTFDFRLSPGSPAIDRGYNTFVSGVTTDLDGNPRLYNGVVDLGAYECIYYHTLIPLILR